MKGIILDPPRKASSKLLKTVPIQPLSAGVLPPQFHHTHCSSAMKTNAFITDCGCISGSGSILCLPTVMGHKEAYKKRALRQKQEIMSWLSVESPSGSELLRKLSKCNTSYSKLLMMAAEELEMDKGVIRSHKSEKVEAESALTCANLEVDCERQQTETDRIRAENDRLAKRLNKHREVLNTLNREIDSLRHLLEIHGFDERKPSTRPTATECSRRPIEQEPEVAPKVRYIEPNSEEVQKLWNEGSELAELLQALEAKLKEKQAEQLTVLADLTKRRIERRKSLY